MSCLCECTVWKWHQYSTDPPECQHLNISHLGEDGNLEGQYQGTQFSTAHIGILVKGYPVIYSTDSGFCFTFNRTWNLIVWLLTSVRLHPLKNETHRYHKHRQKRVPAHNSHVKTNKLTVSYSQNTHQQFSFFTLSKSEAFALARTSFRVSFIIHGPRWREKLCIKSFTYPK